MNIHEEEKDDQRNRIHFTHEENIYLVQLVNQFKSNNNNNEKWEKITRFFNSKFPNTQRKRTAIQNHYNNTLNPNLKRDRFSKDEEEHFNKLFKIYGKQIRKIASIMKRTESSVQNHFIKTSYSKSKQTKTFFEKEICLLHSDFLSLK
jgi:hypothetical protein